MLSRSLRIKLDRVEAVIVTCGVLHNIAIECKDRLPPSEIEGFEEMMRATEVPNERVMEGTSEGQQLQSRSRSVTARDWVLDRHFALLQSMD